MAQTTKSIAGRVVQIASHPRSSLRHFPPAEAIFSPNTHTHFSPEIWANLQEPPTSALLAFAHRIGLGKILTDPQEILQACTHRSYPPFYANHRPEELLLTSNLNLASLGNSLLGLFATEYVNTTYSHLPTRALKAAIVSYVGPYTCANVAKEMGAAPLLRWQKALNPVKPKEQVTLDGALSTIPKALTALVYHHRSLPVARRFANAFFLSREVDMRPLLKFTDPKTTLLRTVSKFQMEKPVSRLLKETGRLTNSPIYVVGVYSGAEKLGEGFGSSLKMAEFRAAEDALHRLYLTRTPSDVLSIPSTTFPDGVGSVFDLHGPSSEKFVPGDIGESEVLYESSDR